MRYIKTLLIVAMSIFMMTSHAQTASHKTSLPRPASNKERVNNFLNKSNVYDSANPWTLRTNMLYWLGAMPNIGAEYRINENWGVVANITWTHIGWKGGDRQHKLLNISPEVRRYLGDQKRWFVGAELHFGESNFKYSDVGEQGDFFGGGITGGYIMPLSRVLDLEFSLGLGYTDLAYQTYTYDGENYIKKEQGLSKGIVMPTQVGVSLIWKIGR